MGENAVVFDGLMRFVESHRLCAGMTGDADSPVDHGYRLWVACSCGAMFERWVTPEAAEADLVFSTLSVLPN